MAKKQSPPEHRGEAPPVPPELSNLADHMARFAGHCGFKRIHGRIWCHLFLAGGAVDAGWIINRLRVSKALVSLSLRDLLSYGAIERAGNSPYGTRLFQARSDIANVVLGVLRSRELPMLAEIQAAASQLANCPEAGLRGAWIEPQRTTRITQLAGEASALLNRLLDLPENDPRKLERFNQP